MSPAKRKQTARKAAADPPDAEIIEHVQRPPAVPEPMAYPDPDHGLIGLGGTGSLHGIPDCLVCFAVGGGGHGAGCPNAGKDPEDWVSEPPDGWAGPQARTTASG